MEEENKELELSNIQINYSSSEELDELHSSKEFVSYIQTKVLDKIKYAIDKDLDSVEIFNILNMSLIVELERSNFVDVLNKINQSYLELEQFEECGEIQKLIEKLK